MIPNWMVKKILDIPFLYNAGQLVDHETESLGLGLLYYALVRIYKPQRICVIGSHRGFSVIVMARALQDNNDDSHLFFIDPSLVDNHWKDSPDKYFAKFGLSNMITHYCLTTQEYIDEVSHRNLFDMLLIDGLHTAKQAEFDHNAFYISGPVLFHDSLKTNVSKMYDKPYKCSVGKYIDKLRKAGKHEIFTIPFEPGLTIVQKKAKR